MGQSQYCLAIADIVIAVSSDDYICLPAASDALHPFLTDQAAEVNLRLHYGPRPRYRLQNRCFDAQSTWQMFQHNGEYVFKIFSSLAVLKSDFLSGDIYHPQRERNQPLGYTLAEIIMINLLAQERGMMVHACGIKHNNKGWLFVGKSGAGKSAVANIWSKDKDSVILNDDRLIIRKLDGKYWIYGTPWHGDAKVSSPQKVELKKIFFLNQAKANSLVEVSRLDAASSLVACSFPTFWDKDGMDFTLGFIDQLVQEIPCYQFNFLGDSSIIDFIKANS